jgi:hypothetical protein
MIKTLFEEMQPDEVEAMFQAGYDDFLREIDESIAEGLRRMADHAREQGMAPEATRGDLAEASRDITTRGECALIRRRGKIVTSRPEKGFAFARRDDTGESTPQNARTRSCRTLARLSPSKWE